MAGAVNLRLVETNIQLRYALFCRCLIVGVEWMLLSSDLVTKSINSLLAIIISSVWVQNQIQKRLYFLKSSLYY